MGARIRGRIRGLDLGQSFELKKNRPATVVGVFEAEGSSYESEVWVDRDRDLLPARLRLVDREGAVLDQVIREARTELRESPNAEW